MIGFTKEVETNKLPSPVILLITGIFKRLPIKDPMILGTSV